MSNSPLVTYTRISPNRTSPRNHKIDTITIHCYVGQVTAKTGCNGRRFTIYNPISGASCNYVVGYDGSIGLCVPESDRSWCSSNKANDHRAITIEVACEPVHPYKVTDAAMAALIELVADICRRNDIKELKWRGDKTLIGQTDKQNMTVHRWFKNKACPGDYLYGKHSYIAAEVNKRLGNAQTADTPDPFAPALPYKVRITASSLNVRRLGSTKSEVVATVRRNEVYTITAECDGWGKLKSNVGWICLSYTKRL